MSGCLDQSTPLQSGFDVLACDAEVSGDLMQTHAIGEHPGGGVCVPSKFVMLERMFAMIDDFEVFNPVVGFITIDMVDIFGSDEFAVQMGGHDAAMFFYNLPVKLGDRITLGVDLPGSSMIGVTNAATKHLGIEFDVVGMALKRLSATPTIDSDHAEQITNQIGRTEAIIRRYGLAGLMAGGGAAALSRQQSEQ